MEDEYSPFLSEELYCTDLGYWILNRVRAGNPDTSTYEKISDELARQWLLDNEYPEEAKRRFDRSKGGRPSKGDKVEARVPAKTLSRIDDMAAAAGVDRPEMIRRLLVVAVGMERALAAALD
ncbi:ribbon-helix-helix protein, CopG family [Streptomyces sp. RTd22]|uniref:ribbon-helix-helix protein, CopG family n=1 Tax=Streptomyces sp. RTd22 TaxID=1841249 RepID=UPI0007DA0321|nr:ribbon-helix-helix protein, CopG family [Streptomyces sp. RTd22]